MSNYKLKLVDRRTCKVRVLTLQEFNKEFSNVLLTAISLYESHERRKNLLPPFMDYRDYKQDFYNSLKFNFNSYSCTCCSWYIENII